MTNNTFNLEQFKQGHAAIARNGTIARFHAFDLGHESNPYPLGAKLEGLDYPCWYTEDGRYFTWVASHPFDLIGMVEEEIEFTNPFELAAWELAEQTTGMYSCCVAINRAQVSMEGQYSNFFALYFNDDHRHGYWWSSDDRMSRLIALDLAALLWDEEQAKVIDPLAEFKSAFAAGKTVQLLCRDDKTWTDLTHPKWNAAPDEYRLKPEEADPFAELKAAHAAGKTIQAFSGSVWLDCATPMWFEGEYRIKPEEFPAPPEGQQWHNPQHFTPEQVGVSEGWRLLLVGEQIQKGDMFDNYDRTWVSSSWVGVPVGGIATDTYRTKRPLPATPPKASPKLVPLEAEDIPPVCWMRRGHSYAMLVQTINRSSVGLSSVSHGLRFEVLMDEGWEYSSDRREWKKCSKLEEAK